MWVPPHQPVIQRNSIVVPYEVEMSPFMDQIVQCYMDNISKIYSRHRITDLEERYNFALEDRVLNDEVLPR